MLNPLAVILEVIDNLVLSILKPKLGRSWWLHYTIVILSAYKWGSRTRVSLTSSRIKNSAHCMWCDSLLTTMPRTTETASFKVISPPFCETHRYWLEWPVQSYHDPCQGSQGVSVLLPRCNTILVYSLTDRLLNWTFSFTDPWNGFPLWYSLIINLTLSKLLSSATCN